MSSILHAAFDDWSHRKDFPASMQLAVELKRAGAEFDERTALEFVARFRARRDRGWKAWVVLLVMRAAMEAYNGYGHGNRALRRVRAYKVVRTDLGIGQINARGELVRADGAATSYPKVQRVELASVSETATFFKARAARAEWHEDYYRRRPFAD